VQVVTYPGCSVMETMPQSGLTHTQQPEEILRASLAQLSHSFV